MITFKQFLSEAKDFEKHAETFKDHHVDAIWNYHHNAGDVNRHLRGVKNSDEAPHIIKDMDHVTSGKFNKSRKLYRGVYGNESKHIAALKPGETHSDPAYVSTSTRRKVSDRFSKEDKHVLQIHAPKGTKGHSISMHTDKESDMPSEHEIVLHRNTKFKILKHEHKDGIRHTHLQVQTD